MNKYTIDGKEYNNICDAVKDAYSESSSDAKPVTIQTHGVDEITGLKYTVSLASVNAPHNFNDKGEPFYD